jgi:hypothetical protein
MVQTQKHWCWTLNNWTNDEEAIIQARAQDSDEIEYLIYGKEGQEQGRTPHLQGFVCLKQRRSLAFVKNLLCTRLHAEPRRGTVQQAAEYCEKEGDVWSFGRRPAGQGERSDLKRVHGAIKEGKTLAQIAELHPQEFIRYHSGITKLRSFYQAKRTWQTEVYVYWGATGTGKTRKAFEEAGEDSFIYPGRGWFDGYDGQDKVVFDEYHGGEFPITQLLRLLDRYPMSVQIKGGFVNWKPRKLWITSNISPDDWYPQAKEEHKLALRRRLFQVMHFNAPLVN